MVRSRLTAAAAGMVLLAAGMVSTASAPAGSEAFPGRNGQIAFDVITRGIGSAISVVDADGSNLRSLTDEGLSPKWSPDGTKIAFVRYPDTGDNGEIYVMNADGTNQVRLTNDQVSERDPTWSPDGAKIAYASGDIFVMNADGSNPTKVTSHNSSSTPSWSPDGTKIAYTDTYYGAPQVGVIGADGSDPSFLTLLGGSGPSWSPDGTKIAFTSNRDSGGYRIFVMDTDGSNQTAITDNAINGEFSVAPAWSPDGTKIAFTSNRDGPDNIFVMDADGSNPTLLIGMGPFVGDASWQPIPIPTPPPPPTATTAAATSTPAQPKFTG